VGSVNLATADEVLTTCAEIYGQRLKRIPDGETGERRIWTEWQYRRLAAHPLFEAASPLTYGRYVGLECLKLRSCDIASEQIHFDAPGYADVALTSYDLFARMKRWGRFGSEARFMVALPTPLAVLEYVRVGDTSVVEPAYQRALLGDLRRITAEIPSDQLAVQWDVCHEMAVVEGLIPSPFPDEVTALGERLATLGGEVPEGVELGYHFCYGSWHEEHFSEPRDTGRIVELANVMFANIHRSVEFVHLPVPIDRDDAAYFAPLADLRRQSETEIYLGLVHPDGVDGARRRATAAQPYVTDFGVAEECGLGRGHRDTMRARLSVTARVAAAI
jgi:hypothetical protein